MKSTTISQNRGFTLIELLVVIASIAVLAAMLLPALAKSQPRAAVTVCLANQKQFAVAWNMFSSDHSDYIVSADQRNSKSDSSFSWRIDPNDISGPPTPPGQSAQQFGDDYGFQQGGLYPYIKNADIIHCPADARFAQGLYPAWCSYSMVDNMNGAVAATPDYRIHQASQIKHPNGRMVIDEENDPRQEGFSYYENLGTWEPYKPGSGGDAPNPKGNPPFLTMANGGTPGWYDSPAAFHPNAATFSMCDGHAEVRQWRGPVTIAIVNSLSPNKFMMGGAGSLVNPLDKADVYYVYSHIASPLWP